MGLTFYRPKFQVKLIWAFGISDRYQVESEKKTTIYGRRDIGPAYKDLKEICRFGFRSTHLFQLND